EFPRIPQRIQHGSGNRLKGTFLLDLRFAEGPVHFLAVNGAPLFIEGGYGYIAVRPSEKKVSYTQIQAIDFDFFGGFEVKNYDVTLTRLDSEALRLLQRWGIVNSMLRINGGRAAHDTPLYFPAIFLTFPESRALDRKLEKNTELSMARGRDTIACNSSMRFSGVTFICMMNRIIQVIGANGLPPSERKPKVLS
ncbi:MAG: hypothetical protein LJE96_21820, partial [Deltaproteobacteria bacterium]|nr:hypothetical protein [Deltaproteobacteria bacterium]